MNHNIGIYNDFHVYIYTTLKLQTFFYITLRLCYVLKGLGQTGNHMTSDLGVSFLARGESRELKEEKKDKRRKKRVATSTTTTSDKRDPQPRRGRGRGREAWWLLRQ